MIFSKPHDMEGIKGYSNQGFPESMVILHLMMHFDFLLISFVLNLLPQTDESFRLLSNVF